MKHDPSHAAVDLRGAARRRARIRADDRPRAQDNPPLNLARDGFFYIGGKPTKIDGKTFIAGQMYVEYRIPAKQTHPYPIIFVHGGTRSGANWTGTLRRPRRLGAVFRAPRLRGLCRRPARPRPLRLCARSLRPAALRQCRERAAALPAAGEVQSVAAGEAAHSMARHRRDRRSGVAADPRQLPAGDRVPEIGRDHPRGDGAAPRQASARRSCWCIRRAARWAGWRPKRGPTSCARSSRSSPTARPDAPCASSARRSGSRTGRWNCPTG